ncbi:MAG: leucine-responsive transcriptional regulator Lrp [Calditrichia bacterium]
MDKIDKTILTILQENGRISNVALAKTVGLTPPATLERVRKLEEAGYITGYHARLNVVKLGKGLSCIIALNLVRHEQKSIHEFEEDLKQLNEVEEIYHVTGRFDYLIKVNVTDVQELRNFLVDKLTKIKRVDKAETFMILSSETDRLIKIE